MNKSIQELLGIADDEKRIYRFQDGDVQVEEYQYCQLLDQLVFGDRGYVDTLGQTWEMIHDPRFRRIEGTFVIDRKAIFGGDARVGKQHMSSDGVFFSSISDLEQYGEILGEGRYFWLLIHHPNEQCSMRLWYERIYPEVLAKKNIKAPAASPDLKCSCDSGPYAYTAGGFTFDRDPHKVKDYPDEMLWAFIKNECPNYFSQLGRPNAIARRLFALFRADILGLVADYCPTPMVDAFIEMESGDVIHDKSTNVTPTEKPDQVFLEVDILEKALTYRATMRATAAKILRQMGIETYLQTSGVGDMRLTDEERDSLLRMVYQSDWPNDKTEMMMKLLTFVSGVTRRPFEEREKEQLDSAKNWSLETCNMLRTGETQPINSYTEPSEEVKMDPHAAVMEAILRHPLKQELFIIWVEAEERSTSGKTDTDQLNMRQLHSVLTPVFTDPEFKVDDGIFNDYIAKANELGYYNTPIITNMLEGSLVPSEEDFQRNRQMREARGEKRTPLPPDEPPKEKTDEGDKGTPVPSTEGV